MKDEDLTRYIDFNKTIFQELQNDVKYKWFFDSFRREIINVYFNDENTSKDNGIFQNITINDVNRIKAYLNFIDKKAINFGKIFYEKISDNKLKLELIKDFKEMKVALKNDDIIEFGRRMTLQLENIFNYSLNSLDIHNLMSSNPIKFKSIVPNWKNYQGDPLNFYDSFFSSNEKTNQIEPIPLSRLSFKMKALFLSIFFNYYSDKKCIDDMYFLRNKASHRDQISFEDKQKLNQIIYEFDNNYSRYHKLLYDVLNGINNL